MTSFMYEVIINTNFFPRESCRNKGRKPTFILTEGPKRPLYLMSQTVQAANKLCADFCLRDFPVLDSWQEQGISALREPSPEAAVPGGGLRPLHQSQRSTFGANLGAAATVHLAPAIRRSFQQRCTQPPGTRSQARRTVSGLAAVSGDPMRQAPRDGRCAEPGPWSPAHASTVAASAQALAAVASEAAAYPPLIFDYFQYQDIHMSRVGSG
ncbi:hypothetical protein HispidOSU_013903 [Sigmodon hispidus]